MKLNRLLTIAVLCLPPAAHAIPGVPFTSFIARVDAVKASELKPHPRLLLTLAEQARVRQACKTERGKPYWDAVRKYVDAEKTVAVPGDPPPFKDGKWTIEEWRRIVNSGGDAQNHVLAAAFAWVVTQSREDLAEAKRWTLGVAQWNPHGPSAIEGVDHPAHDVLHALCLSYDWLYNQWTPEERGALEHCIAERGAGLYKHLKPYKYDSWNNHPWFQTTALVEAGLALADKNPEADEWWRYGSNLYFTEFLPLGGRDGDWHEGTHYISYTLIFVYQWADALRTATGVNAYQVPWLKEVGYFRLYTHPPLAGGIKFNDNNFTRPDTWDRMTAYNAAKNTGDPVLQWYADTMSVSPPSNPIPALYTLIARNPSLPAKAPGKDMPLGVWYRDSGWVVMRTDLSRSDDTQFGLKAGPHLAEKGGKGHDHPDQNGFLINSGGDALAVDSGYYDYYGSPHHTNWTFTAKAHNTILVDGVGQDIAPEKAAKVVSFVSSNTGLAFVEGEAATAYPAATLKSWRRQVLFIRPSTFLVRDVIQPVKPAKITWMLHGPSEFALRGQDFRTAGAKAELRGSIVEPAGLTIKQWGGFPENAQPERKKPGAFPDEWHLTAETPEPVSKTVGLTIYQVGPKENKPAPTVTRETDGTVDIYTLDEGETNILCMFSRAPGRWQYLNAISDARAIALRQIAPFGEQVLLSHVTFLRSGLDLAWASTVPADVSAEVDQGRFMSLTVRLDSIGKARFASAKPKGITVDGKKAVYSYDSKTKTAALNLPAGTHEIVVK